MSDINDLPTAGAARAAMAAEINRDFNRLIDQGAITGVEKIPTPGAPAPTATPAAAASPAPAAITPASAPAVAPPASTSPFSREVEGLGKYNSLDELRKGYFNAVNTLSTTLDGSAAKDAEIASLRQQLAAVNPPQTATVPAPVPGGLPRVNPAARNPIDINDPVLAKFAEESSVPVDLLVQAIDRIATTRAEQISAETVDGRLTPLTQMSQAENQMRAKHPDSVNHVPEVTNFLKSSPEDAQMVAALYNAGQPYKALEYGWKAYQYSLGVVTEQKMVANAAVAEEERVAARAAAGFPTSPNTGVMAAAPTGNDQPVTREELQALNDAAGSGLSQDHAAVIRRRRMLGQMLPPQLRTWEQR